ncbi:MAG: DUF1573 domain-containing protein [Acidobacteria bacterium]|nr:DUF1573 domain-containing protein [Acidobacteriota bacterium]
MSHTATTLIVLFFLGFSWAFAAGEPPRIEFDQTFIDLGSFTIGATREFSFHFRNQGGSPLEITDIKATCGCTVTRLSDTRILPGGGADLHVTYTAPNQREIAFKYLFVHSNDPDNPKVKLTVRAEVVTDLEWSPHAVKLDWPVGNAYTGKIRLKALGENPIKVLAVTAEKGLVAPRVDHPEGREVTVTFSVTPGAEFQKSDSIQIQSTSADFPEIMVPVYFRRESKLTLHPQHLFFQKRMDAEDPWRYLRISRRDGEKLMIQSVASSISHFKVEIIENNAPVCMVKVSFVGPMPPGRYDSYLTIVTDLEETRMFVSGRCLPDEKK